MPTLPSRAPWKPGTDVELPGDDRSPDPAHAREQQAAPCGDLAFGEKRRDGRHAQVAAAGPMRRATRRPETAERLHRLRRELSKISPAPHGIADARDKIVDALHRAGLAGWTVPPLDDPATTRCADGSVRIGLLSHAICINPCGAFCIVDLHSGRSTYFEMRSRCGRAFAWPVCPDSTEPVPSKAPKARIDT
jgi:hypothetical protein